MRYSVAISPDSETAAEVNVVRARYDAHVELVGPHITIAFPDRLVVPVEEAKARIAIIASNTEPFTVSLDRWVSANDLLSSHAEQTRFLIDRYPNAVNVIVLPAGSGAAEMVGLRRALSRIIPQPALLVEYPPYMCVGQSLSDVEFEAALAELADFRPAYRFDVTGIELFAEQADGSWTQEAAFPLGAPAGGDPVECA